MYNKYETRVSVEARLLPNLDHRPKRGGQVQLSFQNLTDQHMDALCWVVPPSFFFFGDSFILLFTYL